MRRPRDPATRVQQQGLALVVVLQVLLLISILGLGAAQIAMMNERGARNDRDAQSALQSAEAGLADAIRDIDGPPAAVARADAFADGAGIDYHGYGKGRNSQGEKGTLVAAFDGKHGWFWRNRSGNPVTLTLRTNGAYSTIRRVV